MKQSIKRKVVFLVAILFTIAMVITGCEEEDSNKSIYDTSKIKVEQPTSDFYVNDFADIISDENETKMQDRAVELDKDYDGIQVVVTTVKSLNNYNVDEYAHAMYNQYGIGKDDMGVLILLSTGERQIKIETGGKMDAYIPGSVSGRLIDENALSYLKEDKFDEGLESLQNAVIEYIKEKVPNEQTNASSTNNAENNAVVTQAKKDTTSQSEKSDNNKSTKTDNSSVVKKANTSDKISESDESETSNQSSLYLILIGIFAIVLITLIYQIVRLTKKIESYKNQDTQRVNKIDSQQNEIYQLKNERDKEIKDMRKDYEEQILSQRTRNIEEIAQKDQKISEIKKQNNELTTKLSACTEKIGRAITLHPNLDSEILEMIESEYKASAQEIDKKIAEILSKNADKDSIAEFESAIALYKYASPDVQKYITGDINRLTSLYTQSVELKKEFDRKEKEKKDKKKADEAYHVMQSLVRLETDVFYEDYEKFSRAKAVYDNLTSDQRKYFPDPIWLASFNKSFALAEKDYEIYTSAKQKEKEINKIISRASRAEEDDLDRIDSALMIYKSLNEEEKRFVPENLFAKLKKMKHAAEDDHEDKERERERKRRKQREEEEERRRRASYSSSSYSHHSSSSFGSSHHSGHGGISHGGGAHRGF